MRAIPTRKLDKRITRVWRLSAIFNVLFWSLLCIVPVLIAWVFTNTSTNTTDREIHFWLGVSLLAMTALVAIAFVFFVIIAPKIRWIQWSFEVLEEEIDIHKGIFWRKRIIIPLIRVQDVNTQQGPIMRANKLASFTVATAAGEHAIPGLDVAEADALRDRVAVLARIAQEDV